MKANSEEIGEGFNYEAPDGSRWEMAFYTVKSTSYTRFAKPVNRKKATLKRVGKDIYHVKWGLTARKEAVGKFKVFVPKVVLLEELEGEMLDFIKKCM